MKFVHFEGVFTTLDQPTGLVDNTWLAKRHQLLGIFQGNLVLKFIAGKPAVKAWTFDGQKGLIITDSDAHRPTTLTADIALPDVGTSKSLVLVRIVKHEEFAFNFLSHKR